VNPLVSVCIPTCRRPDLLREAIASVLVQAYPKIELVISDDSPDDSTEKALRESGMMESVRYYRNGPPLGQAGNVNHLFDLANGDRLVLLHDDDLLMPGCLEDLAACWDIDPGLTAAFGKHYVISAGGALLDEKSRRLNHDYHRGENDAGQQPALWSALVGQFPNDGYMVLSEAARRTRYRVEPEVGDACDYDFALRLARPDSRFYFIDKYTAKYRLTEASISMGNTVAAESYLLVEGLVLPAELEKTRAARLGAYAPAAINRWLRVGDKRNARRVYFSRYNPLSKRCSPMGIVQGLLLACPTPISKPLTKGIRQARRKLWLNRRNKR